MSKKSDFIKKTVQTIGILSEAYLKLSELRRVYYDDEFDFAGADEISDSDCANAGYSFTASELENVFVMTLQLYNFMNNTYVTLGDYDKTCNILKDIN